MLYILTQEELDTIRMKFPPIENKRLAKKLIAFLNALDILINRTDSNALEFRTTEADCLRVRQAVKVLVAELEIPTKEDKQQRLGI